MNLETKDYVQVRQVLKNFSNEDQNKVPANLINLIEANANESNYNLVLDTKKPLEDQISRQAMACIIYIVTKYIANNEQRNRIKEILVSNSKDFQKAANERLEKIRQNNVDKKYKKIEEKTTNLPTAIKKENFFTKIINQIKKLFNLKKRS